MQRSLSYDVHRDQIIMGGRSDAYDNPVYETHADVQNYRNEAAAGLPPNTDYPVKGAQAPPLPVKEPILEEEIDIKVREDTSDRTAFENPMFGVNGQAMTEAKVQYDSEKKMASA